MSLIFSFEITFIVSTYEQQLKTEVHDVALSNKYWYSDMDEEKTLV